MSAVCRPFEHHGRKASRAMSAPHDSEQLTQGGGDRDGRAWFERDGHPGDSSPASMQLARLLAPALGDGAAAAALATALLVAFRSISAVFQARPDRLAAVPGMTEATLQLLAAAHDLACLAAHEAITARQIIGSQRELEDYMRLRMRGRPTEAVLGLYLDRRNGLIREVLLGEGTVDHAPLYPREVVRHALLLDASAVILVHNHPSGDPAPSDSDAAMTRQVAAALSTLDIALHDHFIVGNDVIVSMRQLRRF